MMFSTAAHAGFQAYQLQKNEVVKLDGKLDEAVWKSVAPHTNFFQTQPFDNVAAHLRTEVRVMYDERFLYVGVTGFDNDPSQIRDSFARRDKISIDQDFFAFIDARTGFRFNFKLIQL